MAKVSLQDRLKSRQMASHSDGRPVKTVKQHIPQKGESALYEKIHSEPVNKKKTQVDTNSRKEEEEYEDQLLEDQALKERRENIRIRKRDRNMKILQWVLVVGCVYVVFLIYGVINTNYVYNDAGVVVPQKMTMQQIKKMEEFDKLALQYRQARTLYEQVLVLDYRVGAGLEDPMLIAPEYDKLLDQVNQLVIQIGAINLPSKYSQAVNMLNAWVKDDIAIYCQNMSSAIAKNSAEHADRALQYKVIVYNDFSLLTQNIALLGSQVEGVDIEDIIKWSPENYIQNEIGGVLNGG